LILGRSLCVSSSVFQEKRRNPIPKLSDLRDNGIIEQDAGVVLFLHRTGR
jgi:replicative DNA helicase